MNILVSRNSICLANDMENYAKECFLNDNATYENSLEKMKADNCFPNISGNNVV